MAVRMGRSIRNANSPTKADEMARRSAFAQREPNGREQRHRLLSPTEARRLREAAWRGLRDAQWGTELGRLLLENLLTEQQFLAGQQWRQDVAAYHWAIDVFPVRSAKLELGKGGKTADPDSEAGRKLAKRESEAIETFFAAHTILSLTGAEKIVRALVERDEPICGILGLRTARKGLSVLAEHYGLTNQGNFGNVRKPRSK
jgi:hypothetical protein